MTEAFKSVPMELRELPQWVTRRGKIPYTPQTGTCAKAGVTETWGTFDEAVKAWEAGGYDGIGFEFATCGGIVGVDLDHVVNPDTGEIHTWALGIVERLNSYTEYSPSGTGLHIFVFGDIPVDGRKKVINKESGAAVEMYKAKRYFTVTGKALQAVPVMERDTEIVELYKELFPEQQQLQEECLLSVQVPEYLQIGLERDKRLQALWNGQRDISDESACDLALLNKLAYWCNRDTGRMVEAFLRSPYAAQKDAYHRRKLTREDYLLRTARLAAEGTHRTAAEDDGKYQQGRTETCRKEKITSFEENSGKAMTIQIVEEALNELGIDVRYNLLLKENEINGMPKLYSPENAVNILPILLSDYMKSFGIKGVRREIVVDCLNVIADKNRYNPVFEYLNGGVWDKTDRLDDIYSILGICDDKYRTYVRKWLIQCVALALNDEREPIGSEGVLVLQGEQGIAKTSFFRILSPFPRWFVEGAVIDITNKDTLLKALSSWITELGELDSTLKREQSALKAFITQPEDRIRAPYARTASRSARRTSFCGTVNPQDYLRDETGSRRFWTIPISSIDKKTLFSLSREWVNQLWYQVYDIYKLDKNGFRLTCEEMRQLQIDNQAFDVSLPFEEEVRALMDYYLPLEKWEWWKAADVANRIIGYPSARRIGKVLAKITRENAEFYGGKADSCNLTKYNRFLKNVHNVAFYLLPLKH